MRSLSAVARRNSQPQQKMKTMKTLTTITCIAGNTESRHSFIRAYSAKKPTYAGAARMVAAKFNADNDSNGEYPMLKPSEISVSRIEICDYQTR
jgi:hypothetical protein